MARNRLVSTLALAALAQLAGAAALRADTLYYYSVPTVQFGTPVTLQTGPVFAQLGGSPGATLGRVRGRGITPAAPVAGATGPTGNAANGGSAPAGNATCDSVKDRPFDQHLADIKTRLCTLEENNDIDKGSCTLSGRAADGGNPTAAPIGDLATLIRAELAKEIKAGRFTQTEFTTVGSRLRSIKPSDIQGLRNNGKKLGEIARLVLGQALNAAPLAKVDSWLSLVEKIVGVIDGQPQLQSVAATAAGPGTHDRLTEFFQDDLARAFAAPAAGVAPAPAPALVLPAPDPAAAAAAAKTATDNAAKVAADAASAAKDAAFTVAQDQAVADAKAAAAADAVDRARANVETAEKVLEAAKAAETSAANAKAAADDAAMKAADTKTAADVALEKAPDEAAKAAAKTKAADAEKVAQAAVAKRVDAEKLAAVTKTAADAAAAAKTAADADAKTAVDAAIAAKSAADAAAVAKIAADANKSNADRVAAAAKAAADAAAELEAELKKVGK
jgi:hypothetical protein